MTCDPENPAPPADLWTRARADYLAGHSAPVVAERYGLSERTVRRRAADDGWRRADRPLPDEREYSGRGFLCREEMLERFPELGEVEQAEFNARFSLLIEPDQKALRRFAFRQAAEAVVWMRLVQTLEQTGDRIDREAGRFRQEDRMRAAYLRETDRRAAESPRDEA